MKSVPKHFQNIFIDIFIEYNYLKLNQY